MTNKNNQWKPSDEDIMRMMKEETDAWYGREVFTPEETKRIHDADKDFSDYDIVKMMVDEDAREIQRQLTTDFESSPWTEESIRAENKARSEEFPLVIVEGQSETGETMARRILEYRHKIKNKMKLQLIFDKLEVSESEHHKILNGWLVRQIDSDAEESANKYWCSLPFGRIESEFHVFDTIEELFDHCTQERYDEITRKFDQCPPRASINIPQFINGWMVWVPSITIIDLDQMKFIAVHPHVTGKGGQIRHDVFDTYNAAKTFCTEERFQEWMRDLGDEYTIQLNEPNIITFSHYDRFKDMTYNKETGMLTLHKKHIITKEEFADLDLSLLFDGNADENVLGRVFNRLQHVTPKEKMLGDHELGTTPPYKYIYGWYVREVDPNIDNTSKKYLYWHTFDDGGLEYGEVDTLTELFNYCTGDRFRMLQSDFTSNNPIE